MYLNYIFASQRRRCRSENIEEEEGMLHKDQLLDHSGSDDDEPENRASEIKTNTDWWSHSSCSSKLFSFLHICTFTLYV